MRLLRLHALDHATQLPPLAMTIGNFDGVHLGHQAVIQQLKHIAQKQQLQTAIMLFEPQPLEFFLGGNAPPRITSFREKIKYLQQLDIDFIILVRFDEQFRQHSAQAFANLLAQRLNVQHLVLGDDFHFGKDRQGNRDFLRQAGFAVESLHTVEILGDRVSSTRIRQTLLDGDFQLASQLLGRPYRIMGRVVRGDQIGRTLNFPTLNIDLKRHKPCLHGIYAVDVQDLHTNLAKYVTQQNPQHTGIAGYGDGHLLGAGHVGTRPAIAQQQPEWRLEVHLPQVSADLYGRFVEITFLKLMHGE
ncbi:MAG: riboflavin biosynthesis protein RibF, partial [Acinetobacter sp.]|nr:riboflavin biosynthesis protein RibF [Acinetobacter sp.]